MNARDQTMTQAEAGVKANGVALWLARVDALDAAGLARAKAALQPDERARAARFRVEGARTQFVAARTVLRAMLIHYGGADALHWRLRVDAHGKPWIDATRPAFVFNLSHTQGLVACVVALNGEVGVDVERVADAGDLLALARQSFSPAEAAHVAELSGAARVEAFFAYWTLKEAYVKARGLGLSLDPTAFSFDLGPPDALRAVSDGDDRGRWRFLRAAPKPDIRLALAAAAPLDLDRATTRWVDVESCLDAIAAAALG